jgi:hypothetical protein
VTACAATRCVAATRQLLLTRGGALRRSASQSSGACRQASQVHRNAHVAGHGPRYSARDTQLRRVCVRVHPLERATCVACPGLAEGYADLGDLVSQLQKAFYVGGAEPSASSGATSTKELPSASSGERLGSLGAEPEQELGPQYPDDPLCVGESLCFPAALGSGHRRAVG